MVPVLSDELSESRILTEVGLFHFQLPFIPSPAISLPLFRATGFGPIKSLHYKWENEIDWPDQSGSGPDWTGPYRNDLQKHNGLVYTLK